MADVAGFGGHGTGWSRNAASGALPADITRNVVTLTTEARYVPRSVWHLRPQAVTTGWSARFTYSRPRGSIMVADGGSGGFAFVLQAAGPNALGGTVASGRPAGNIGYSGRPSPPQMPVLPSVAVTLVHATTIAGSWEGLGVVTNGAFPPSKAGLAGSLDLQAGATPIVFTATYDPATGLLSVLAKQGARRSARAARVVNLTALFGQRPVLVGFTGAAEFQNERISGFQFQTHFRSTVFGTLTSTRGGEKGEGTLTITRLRSGSFSGRLAQFAGPFAFKGQLGSTGRASILVPRAGRKPLKLDVIWPDITASANVTVSGPEGTGAGVLRPLGVASAKTEKN
jgi:hypothetical protein